MRILVIEDEHQIVQALKKGLQQERYAVDLAYDGVEGYDLAATEDYDLIILDLMLPGIDGLEICRRLRKDNLQMPILMLTAKSQLQDKVMGLDSGADDYLTKPFSFEELLARIRALIRRPKNQLNEILSIADLQVDSFRFEVKRGKRPITLTKKEFSLLEYLIRHQNQIVTKEQIISHVWDYSADILPNTVEVYIKRLRAKVDLNFPKQKPLIQTSRGFGYKISAQNV